MAETVKSDMGNARLMSCKSALPTTIFLVKRNEQSNMVSYKIHVDTYVHHGIYYISGFLNRYLSTA